MYFYDAKVGFNVSLLFLFFLELSCSEFVFNTKFTYLFIFAMETTAI